MLGRFELESDKKAIIFFIALGFLMLLYLAGSALNGSVDCFAGRNLPFHVIYDSVPVQASSG